MLSWSTEPHRVHERKKEKGGSRPKEPPCLTSTSDQKLYAATGFNWCAYTGAA